ncbi:MAG TPA: hypothetical protein PLU72_17485 [Candidatus Ozemobacteraceae bacterium]|nr:hypothetical protein [Candidatus Ozemobacteraceae bacterium]
MSTRGASWFSGVVAIAIVAVYAHEHPLFGMALADPSGLPYILGKGALAFAACVAGIQTMEWIGRGVLALFRSSSACPVARFSVGLVWLTLGSVALLTLGFLRPVTALLLLVPLVAAIRLPRAGNGSILAGIHGASWLVLLAFGVMAGVCALAPSTAHDDHVYHLQAIREFSETGTLWQPSPQLNTYRPLAHAAFLAWLRLLTGDLLGGLGNLLFLTGAGLLMARTYGLSGTVGLLAWVSNPELVFLAGSSYVEPFQCLVFVAILTLLGSSGLRSEASTCRIAGLLAGLLPATKYLGLALLPVVAILAYDLVRRGKIPWKACSALLAGGLISLGLGAGPFYWRNLVMTGNPLYPHASGVFQAKPGLPGLPFDRLPAGSKDLIDFSYEAFTDRFGMGHEIENLLLVPWNVIIHGHFHSDIYPLKYFDGQLSPLVLVFGLLLLSHAFGFRISETPARTSSDLGEECGADLRAILACAVWLLGIWLLGSHQIRFLLPLVALLAWAAPLMVFALPPRRLAFWMLLGIVSCTWTASYGLNRIARVEPAVSGAMPADRFLASKFPFYACFDWANRHLTGEGKILVLLEERTYHLRRPHLWTGLLPHHFINFLYRSGSAAEAERLLKEQGIAYIYLPRHAAALYANIDSEGFRKIQEEFFQKCLTPVYSDPQCALLTWKSP